MCEPTKTAKNHLAKHRLLPALLFGGWGLSGSASHARERERHLGSPG